VSGLVDHFVRQVMVPKRQTSHLLWASNFLFVFCALIFLSSLPHCSGKGYEPNDQVKAAHEIPHLDWSLRRKSNKFDLSSTSDANSYGMSLIVLPTIIFCLVAAAVILFQLALIIRSCARCCCSCGKCITNAILGCFNKATAFKEKYIDVHVDPKTQHRRAKIAFVFIIIATIVSISIVFDGDRRMNTGVHEMQDGLDYVSDVAVSIEDHLDNMVVEAVVVQNYLDDNSCPSFVSNQMDDIAVYIGYFNGAIDDSKVVTRSVPRGVDIANEHMEKYAVRQKGIVIFFFFIAVVVLALLFAIAGACKNACMLKLLIFITELLVIALVGICCVEMVIVVSMLSFFHLIINYWQQYRFHSHALSLTLIIFRCVCRTFALIRHKASSHSLPGALFLQWLSTTLFAQVSIIPLCLSNWCSKWHINFYWCVSACFCVC
jgi:hypothetical protein